MLTIRNFILLDGLSNSIKLTEIHSQLENNDNEKDNTVRS